MCLNSISNKPFKPEKENGHNVGWKIFSMDDYYHIYPQFQSSKIFKINRWIHEKSMREGKNEFDDIRASDNQLYEKGFHIYLSKEDAMKNNFFHEKMRKVYYRKPVAYGYQAHKKVVVAKEIFILSIRKV